MVNGIEQPVIPRRFGYL